MDKFNSILDVALELGASDIHLLEENSPVYRVGRNLIVKEDIEPLNKFDLESLLEYLVDESLEKVELFETHKRLDLPYEYKNTRFRINSSLAASEPTFSIRIVKGGNIDAEELNITSIINAIKSFNSGLVLITGKVNSGKTTTLNAYVQSINKMWNKKVVMLEEPVEYVHNSDKSIIVQKEVGKAGDVPTYYDGVINLLREDADIAIIGEIRDRKTMDAVLDLAEAGGLVIGTLHTRSCGETLDRILAMYAPEEQKSIKYILSSALKSIVCQKLVRGLDGKLIMIPEVMMVNKTIAALIRQDKFSVSEIKDSINLSNDKGTISFERSFAKAYNDKKIDKNCIKENVDEDEYNFITKLIGGEN